MLFKSLLFEYVEKSLLLRAFLSVTFQTQVKNHLPSLKELIYIYSNNQTCLKFAFTSSWLVFRPPPYLRAGSVVSKGLVFLYLHLLF